MPAPPPPPPPPHIFFKTQLHAEKLTSLQINTFKMIIFETRIRFE